MALTNKLTAIGDAIRAKTGSSDKLTFDGMASAIANISTGGGGIDPSALAFTGSLAYFNYNGRADNLLTTYGAQCSFTDISSLERAFSYSKGEYPITINGNINNTCDLSYCFNSCKFKQLLPLIKNIKPYKIGGFLSECRYITTIPDDYADTWDFTYLNSNQTMDVSTPCMSSCYSLRKAPRFIKHIYSQRTDTSFNPYNGLLSSAYNIDEIIGYPCPPVNYTSNILGSLYG